VDIRAGEIPVFWACGVTPQAVVMKSKYVTETETETLLIFPVFSVLFSRAIPSNVAARTEIMLDSSRCPLHCDMYTQAAHLHHTRAGLHAGAGRVERVPGHQLSDLMIETKNY
jgi:hypothetical protein